jgi:hypothetical protein
MLLFILLGGQNPPKGGYKNRHIKSTPLLDTPYVVGEGKEVPPAKSARRVWAKRPCKGKGVS